MYQQVRVVAVVSVFALSIGASGMSAGSMIAREAISAQNKPAGIRACSLLTKAEVFKIIGGNKQVFDVVPATEEPIPGGGSMCQYPGAGVQIDPFTPARLEELHKSGTGKEWTAIAGLGDAAYFHDRSKSAPYAELYVRTGTHVVTVQMPVDRGAQPDAATQVAKPKAIALANAILAKLR